MGQFNDEDWEEKDSEVVVAGARRQFARVEGCDEATGWRW
jgi:hypothetical protein